MAFHEWTFPLSSDISATNDAGGLAAIGKRGTVREPLLLPGGNVQ
jgi:hypothetical protein